MVEGVGDVVGDLVVCVGEADEGAQGLGLVDRAARRAAGLPYNWPYNLLHKLLYNLPFNLLYNLPPQAGLGGRNRRSGQVVKGH